MTDLPTAVVDAAERLTRQARAATGEEAAKLRAVRDERLARFGYRSRVREEDDGAVLVCYPDEWLADGTVRPDRIEDVSRAVERRVAGSGDPDDWDEIAAHNDAVVAGVAEAHGPDHAANARALADFASNHYAKRVESLTAAELDEFRSEYYPRNAWPSADQRSVLDTSLELVYDELQCPWPLADGE